ncbi:MAG TPA: NAD(P)H:quinone oxidoreductase [Desulfobacterales bacterium]|nr:NAD(P)H:quinone oxidoreductase [Desulfobacterales bacterium]
MNVLIVFYSMYGHIFRMAEAVAEGAREVEGAKVFLKQVPETLSEDILKKMGAVETKKAFSHIPVASVEDLEAADVVFFGTPTRFGNMCGQMRQFLDATGALWAKGALVGKVGSVFTSTATPHGGQESTILSFHITLLHHGMVIAGLPYTFTDQNRTDKVSGCSPYGASTIAGGKGELTPTEIDLAGAGYQGKYAASIAAKLMKP